MREEGSAPPLSEIIEGRNHERIDDNVNVTLICVRRNHLWSDSVSQFSKPSFDPTKSIRVIFHGEEGVDGGGPRKEYFRLLCRAIRDESGLFLSKDRIVNFTTGVVHFIQKRFHLAGVMIATSILHGGPAFPFFPKVIFDYMTCGKVSMACAVSDVANPDVEAIIKEVLTTSMRRLLLHVLVPCITDLRSPNSHPHRNECLLAIGLSVSDYPFNAHSNTLYTCIAS